MGRLDAGRGEERLTGRNVATQERLAQALKRVHEPPARSLVAGAAGVTLAVVVHGVFEHLHVLSLGLQLSIVWAPAELAGRADDPPAGGLVAA